jgi:hypothetical protein
MTKIAGSGSISQRHGSPDPDPPQNVMDPQHCFFLIGMGLDPDPGNKFCNILFLRRHKKRLKSLGS